MSTLPLKPVVNVYYNLGPIASVRKGFNLGAILGSSTIINTTQRGIVYNSVDEMIEAGFANDSPEILGAQVYFSATSKPSQLYVGRWVKESTYSKVYYQGPIGDGNKVTIGDTTYIVENGTSETTTIANIVSAAETAGATIANIVSAAKTAGATIATSTENTLYILFTANNAGSTGVVTKLMVEAGTGNPVSEVVTEVGEDQETALEAVQACRESNSDWYAIAMTEVLPDSDIESIAAYIEATTNSTPSTYFANSNNDNIINGVESNLFEKLKGLKYQRTIGTCSKQPYTHIGAMGYAMGQTRDTAGSHYTLDLKEIPGTLVDNFTSTQVSNIEGNYGNIYINRGSYYDMYETGKVFSGAWYDEIIQLDKLVNNIQLNIMDVLRSSSAIPQTNAGLARILSTIESACRDAVKIGFVAPGQWNGDNILNLSTGDYLATGYLIQSESFENQSQADRDARKAPYIYVALKLAGAIQSVVVQIDVNR